jgi:nitrogen fixation protein FixH
LQRNREAQRKETVESSSEDELCSAFDDKSNTNFDEFASRYQRGKEDYFLEMDFPLQQGEWILVVSATNKTKKCYKGVTVFVHKGERKVKCP